MSTNTPEALSARCKSIFKGAGEAISWVAEVRGNSQRLDRDADGLIERLRRTRNLSRRLGAAAKRPFSVGVFGMSQAGKSYLVSTLARGEDGNIKTRLEGHDLQFIGHVNPPGGGKEATGLVTRFTRQTIEAPKGYPIELTLFSEADVAKILGNSFFNDFNREKVKFNTEAIHIRQHLAALEKQRQPNPTGGISEDDMVDIRDYFENRFEQSMAPLSADFWPAAIELAPRLPPAARAKLLSVLWNEIPELTDAYLLLRNALAQVSFAGRVYVPLEALVMGSGANLEWRPDSILNVDVLNRLGKDGSGPLAVLPVTDEEVLPEVGVARSLLAALTAEMKFVLADKPVASLLESVDLLDFPGYRGRLDVVDMAEVRKEVKAENDPVAQLLLRGKVAYLFERYTEDQEMNVLMMCTRSDIQIEVTTLAPALSAWVHNTQGIKPEARAARMPGLMWVLTQVDRRLEAKPGLTASQQAEEWTSMIHITLQEKFAGCDWLNDWANGQPFNNVFLVRKPGMLPSTFKVDKKEQEFDFLNPEAQQRLSVQRSMFVDNDAIRRHVRDPGEAWDAVVGINDGGMNRLADYLAGVAVLQTKLDRIKEQIDQITEEIADHRLAIYYQAEGAGEVEKKQRIGEQVSDAIVSNPDAFGELLFSLQPSSEQLRRLYLRAEASPSGDGAGGNEPEAGPKSGRRRMINLPGGSALSDDKRMVNAGRAGVFAKAVISDWIRRLREIPDNQPLARHLDLAGEILQALTDELVTGSDRCRVEEDLVAVLRPLEDKRSTTRIGIVDQQVTLATVVVNDFVDYLGYAGTSIADRPDSPMDGRKIFQPPEPLGPKALPRLAPEEPPYTGTYIVDWLAAFRKMAIGNAGHSAGREITPEQNLRLGTILADVRGQDPAAASA